MVLLNHHCFIYDDCYQDTNLPLHTGLAEILRSIVEETGIGGDQTG